MPPPAHPLRDLAGAPPLEACTTARHDGLLRLSVDTKECGFMFAIILGTRNQRRTRLRTVLSCQIGENSLIENIYNSFK